MSTSFLLIITGVVGVASLISSVVGMSGGILVFFVLTLFFDIKTAIPLHALLLLIANFSRIAIFFRSIHRPTVFWFALLLIPGALLGGLAFNYFSANILQLSIGLMILFTCFVPLNAIGVSMTNRGFVPIGFCTGFLSMIVGSVGPLLAPFLLSLGLNKEEFVATKSACQFLNQLVKIPTFYFMLSFSYGDYIDVVLVSAVATIAGTYLGGKVIGYMSEANFRILVKIVLVGVSFKMILNSI